MHNGKWLGRLQESGNVVNGMVSYTLAYRIYLT
jgi:hypothetical protein